MDGSENIDDIEDVRVALRELLAGAEEAGVDRDAVVGLLTAHLAATRGSVRLPLSMPPARARTFISRAREYEGETMDVELLVSEDVLTDLELQLEALDPSHESG